MMKSTGAASDGIVHQALTKDNYERWRSVMKSYLQGQGLWDVVIKNVDSNHIDQAASKKIKDGNVKKSSWNQNNTQSKTIPDLEKGQGLLEVEETKASRSWKTKNAKALHVIQLSCGREIVDEISHFKTAKKAWNHLITLYGKELKASPDSEQVVLDDSLDEDKKKLYRSVERGDDIENITDPSDVYMTSTSGRTLLHVAVITGNLKNVEKLVKEGKDKLVNMQDNHGDTALALVARYTGNTNIAKCMVERKMGPREEVAESMVERTKMFYEYVAKRITERTKRMMETTQEFYEHVVEIIGYHTKIDNLINTTTTRAETKTGFNEHIAQRMRFTKIDKHNSTTTTTTFVHITKRSEETKKELEEQRAKKMQTAREKRVKSKVETKEDPMEKKKSIVETKKVEEIREKLLEMKNKENVVPVLLAAANGYKELTTYLYSKTPSKVFEDDSQNRVLLLSLCISAEIFDVALKLLKRYEDLPKESLSSYEIPVPKMLRESLSLPINDSHQQSSSDKFSALVALAKMPSAFPSGTRFSRREQFTYDILSVEKEFRDNYEIPADIANFVEKVTRITPVIKDERPLKTYSVDIERPGSVTKVLHFLLFVMISGWLFSKLLVSIFLFWPLKRFGLLLRIIFCGIAYLFVQTFKWLNIFGIRKIYYQKYTHYEVIGILSYFSRCIGEFNSLQLQEASAYEGMLHAAQHGIIEYINAMRDANPDLLSAVDSCYRGIFSYAIMYRKQNIFQLMHGLQGRKEIFRRYRIDTFGNTILHLAAHLGPSSDRTSRSGAALQMQREIQWFKAVEQIVHPKFKEAKNGDGKKPSEIFTENHDELVKAGEKWAKETATSFTIVGTLITTIMFAAAFTVPGGNNQDTGLPIFLHDNAFTVFLIADASSLFTSATSVLIFIGILTSRYAEKDFLKSLPWKLFFALLFLFLSVCSMIVAFCAAIDMILKGYRTYKWFIVGPTMSLGSIPIIVLVLSQVRFMYEILLSTWKNPIRSIKK